MPSAFGHSVIPTTEGKAWLDQDLSYSLFQIFCCADDKLLALSVTSSKT